MQLIPLPEAVKHKVDIAAVPGMLSFPFLQSFDWAQAAAFVATVYGVLRLLEWGVSRGLRLLEWWKARKSTASGSQVVDK